MDRIDIFDPNVKHLLQVNEDPDKIFVYIADVDKYQRYISQFWGIISYKEKELARGYYTNLLTQRYVIAHGILRCILSYYTKELPQNLKFTHNEYGKPFLKESNIQFNISHSHNMFCCVIGFDNKVGIDIEYQDETIDIMELLKLVLTDKEINFFQTIPSEERFDAFYTLWTKKESLIKAIGQGLYYPINTIEALTLTSGDKAILRNSDKNNSKQELSKQKLLNQHLLKKEPHKQEVVEQELYSYILSVATNYYGAVAINNKVNEIIYFEASNKQVIFDNVMVEKM